MYFLLFDQFNLQLLTIENDLEIFHLIDNNREYLGKWLPFIPFTKSVTDTTSFVTSVIQHPNFASQPVFTIREKNKIIGLIGFKDTDHTNLKSEIGYWLAENYQKKGIATEAVKRLCQYGFSHLNLNRIQLKVALGNTPSRNIPLRLGFQLEGMERAGEKVSDHKYRDLEIFSLLKSEFKQP
jgi:ribosomal-protein-serine acetyltransferase